MQKNAKKIKIKKNINDKNQKVEYESTYSQCVHSILFRIREGCGVVLDPRTFEGGASGRYLLEGGGGIQKDEEYREKGMKVHCYGV